MRVRDLGALTVEVDGQDQPIAGTKASALLALLAINANQRVSVDALMEAAWGEQVTAGSASTLTSHVWRLRQLLEPARDRRQPPSSLVNDAEGYRLVCGPATLDSLTFAEAATEVRDLLATGQSEAAVRRADAALALWRGTPYGAFAPTAWAQPAVARLDELRGQLQTRRIEALLESGEPDAALSDLPALIAAMPLRQSLRVLQMEALHRSGRGEQALEAYRQARAVLVEEMGVEPGPELQAMHARILRNEPAPAAPARPAPAVQRSVEVHLPLSLTPLVGRADAVGRLAALAYPGRLVTITGPAGCGKTRIAVEVARTVSARFPDGVWFVDLTAVSDPELVPEVIVSTIGFAGTAGATPVQDLRRYLQTRRLLLVLDNCEHVLDAVDQVVRITLGDPGVTPECGFLTTSREPIGIDGETVWSLTPLDLPADEYVRAPAVELFLQRLASAVPALTIDGEVVARATEIAVALDGLPLPIELAAARAASHSLEDIAAQVAADPGRLSRLGRGPSDHRATVRSAIEWSHRLLDDREQRAHRRLSVLPGAFSSDLAAVVLADADAESDADDLLARLVHRSMLVSERAPGPGRHTTFRQLATVRSHARHALDAAGETERCRDRRDSWSTGLLASRPPLGTAAEVDWYRRIDDDYPTVRASLHRRLVEQPAVEGGVLAYRLAHYWYYRERLVEAARWMQLAQPALADAHATDALLGRIWHGGVHTMQRRFDLVRPLLDGLSAQLDGTAPDRRTEVGEALVVFALGMYVVEEPALLQAAYEVLVGFLDEADGANLALLSDAVGCCALLVTGRFEDATTLARSVQDRAAGADSLMADYVSTAPLIAQAMIAGRPADGLPWIDRCMRTYLRLGTGSVGMFTETRANFVAQLGDYAQAARTYSASRAATRRAGLSWPNRTWTWELLARTRAELGRAAYARAWQEGEQLPVADLVTP